MTTAVRPHRVVLGVSGAVGAAAFVRFLGYASAHLPPMRIAVVSTEVGRMMLDDLDPEDFLDQWPGLEVERDVPRSTSAHVELARWAEAVLVMPATANTIGGLANGLARNLVELTALATRAPVGLVPSMNPAMWWAPSTQRNVRTVVADGRLVLDPTRGEGLGVEIADGQESPAPTGDDLVAFLREVIAASGSTTASGLIASPAEPIRPAAPVSLHPSRGRTATMPDKTARAPDCFSGACDAARSVAAWCSGGDAFRLPDLTAAAEALAHDLPEVLGVQRVWWLDRDGRRAVVGESTHGMLLLDADEPELGADLLQRVVAAGGPRHVLAPESLWRIAPLASSTPAAVHDVFSSDPSLARADLGEGTVLREVPRGSSRATTVAATTRLRALTSSEVRSIELRVVLDRLQSAVADIPVSEEQIDVLAAAVQAGRGIHAICGGEPGQEADDIVGIVLEETAGTSARQVSIAVHPRHERRGHARAALRHLAGVEGARGRRVLTYVAPHNRASAALARSAGFRHVGRIGALEVAT